MSLINLGNGLSEMGKSVADTAGSAALVAQKADLENQKEQLINLLATTRETSLENLRQSGAKDLATTQESLSEKGDAFKSQMALQNIPLIAKAQSQAQIDNANNPKWVAAQKTIVDATATPEQRAQAAYYTQQAFATSIANTTNAELNSARSQLSDATKSGDPDAIRAAQTRLYVAQYSQHDEVQRAAALTAQENNDRLQVTTLQSQLDAKQIPPMAETPDMQSARMAQIQRLSADLAVAKSQYETSHAMAQRAAQNVPTVDLGDAGGPTTGTRPPLSSFNKGTPSVTTPGGGAAPAPGIGGLPTNP